MHILIFDLHSDVKSLRQRLNIMDSPKVKAKVIAPPSLAVIREKVKKGLADRNEPMLWPTWYLSISI